ncbi:hypothetical protein [Nostoc sp. CHAB 5715]|uniref:hypothetical protein n=1 Tax=Nostoc sp. CHAB 5715 TaxID=2780400 RepID=UPI001E29606B|nr:hypothetical protein [Nostoc sp. CHAB 5715]MCC5621291.1 hypothetical protein [Nostoc sp. CHAB 5715]
MGSGEWGVGSGEQGEMREQGEQEKNNNAPFPIPYSLFPIPYSPLSIHKKSLK